MVTLEKSILALVTATLFGACGEGEMMNGARPEMVAALTDVSAENQRHAEACSDAQSLPEMTTELEHYEQNMDLLMARMDDAHRMHCSGPSFNDISGAMADLRSGMVDHAERMQSSGTLEAARSECAAHTSSMVGAVQSMMDDVDSSSCTGGDGVYAGLQ